jgi:hypothetical protein
MTKHHVKSEVPSRFFDNREMDAYDLLHTSADGGGGICLDEYQAQFVVALIENPQLAGRMEDAYMMWLDNDYVCSDDRDTGDAI